eukprot:CAMPEP_0113450132 /NCGR_PEP_ID=MMETSP0014_2-20120614/5665_1 /TAXON_ID=2857 /ORGANISM="Nitzschia sp." /LENGTH=1335 /DNA_ID=CAMNT_0000341447 /DNA_START=136 /DNA_END=4139 /DNA_ORIENTATION=+ /assembly_acc=CAM_ASM_000159
MFGGKKKGRSKRGGGRSTRSAEGNYNTAPPSPIGIQHANSMPPQQITYSPSNNGGGGGGGYYTSDDEDSTYYGTGSVASYSVTGSKNKKKGLGASIFRRGGRGGTNGSVASMPNYPAGGPGGGPGQQQQQQQQRSFTPGYAFSQFGSRNADGQNDKNARVQVLPDDAYPDTYWTHDEMRLEMNKKSLLYHDMRNAAVKSKEVGQIRLEILQCFGLPTSSVIRPDAAAYAIAVCGSAAFKTDVMPPVSNPMWLSKMRRACTLGVMSPYQSLFVGIFDAGANPLGGTKAEDFIGRIAIDIARLRPGCTYDVTLPLRQSAHVYSRQRQGAVRVRFHLNYTNERQAVLSYVPHTMEQIKQLQAHSNVPNTSEAVHCLDDQAFRNVALTVHGTHMPGKFSMTLLRSTVREIDFTRIHIFRYMRRQQWYNLRFYVYPTISTFVFLAWMHAVWFGTVRYVPGHIVLFFLLHLYKNYAYYAMDSPLQNGFPAATVEELYAAVAKGGGGKGKKSAKKSSAKACIEPLTAEQDPTYAARVDTLQKTDTVEAMRAPAGLLMLTDEATNTDLPGLNGGRGKPIDLTEIGDSMRKSLPVTPYQHRFTTYKNCFTGKRAVDFLVTNNFAYSREEAVVIGRRLAKETKLFEHVSRRHDFQDENYFFYFLDNDYQRYKIKSCHEPRGKKILDFLGFYPQRQSGGMTNILEAREHMEFPFAKGTDHPRFTVKDSLAVRNVEAKKLMKDEEEAKEVVDCVEFGVAPTKVDDGLDDETEHDSQYGGSAGGRKSSMDMTGAGSVGRQSMDTSGTGGMGGAAGMMTEKVTRTVRRASLVAATAATSATSAVTNTATAAAQLGTSAVKTATSSALAMTETLGHAAGLTAAKEKVDPNQQMEFGDPEELYEKLRKKNNPTMDNVLELTRRANEDDPYAYDSDDDVDSVHRKRGKRKGIVISEKKLKPPPNQDFSNKTNNFDKQFSKVCRQARHKVHGMFFHAFDDHVYKVNTNLFSTKPDDDQAIREKILNSKKKKRFMNRRQSNDADREEIERIKRTQLTPYNARKDEYDKILYINKYSHVNPWINRVAVIVQPIVEIAQVGLLFIRALFNVFTWQDPFLSFWIAAVGPVVVFALYIAPYRIILAIVGVTLFGPQNYALRLYRESRPGYKPPDFDTIVKSKRPEKEESYDDAVFFSSEAPGNQQIRFKNVEPKQVKQLVVPNNVLKYNRCYDWPPEPEYCRVYASPPPRNLGASRGGLMYSASADEEDSDYDTSTGDAYMYDASNPKPKKKKKKKKGMKKIVHQVKKGTGKTLNATMGVGESMYNMTTDTAGNLVNAGTNVSKKVVKGTAKKAAKGT